MLCEMRGIQDFKLVLCADVWGFLADHAVRELELALEVEWVEGESAGVPPRPLVTCTPRAFPPTPGEAQSDPCAMYKCFLPWAPNPIYYD